MGVLGKHPIPFLLVIVCGFLCFLMLQLSLLLFAKHLRVNRKNLYHQQNGKIVTVKTSHHIVVYVVKANFFSVATQLADVSWILTTFFLWLHVWRFNSKNSLTNYRSDHLSARSWLFWLLKDGVVSLCLPAVKCTPCSACSEMQQQEKKSAFSSRVDHLLEILQFITCTFLRIMFCPANILLALIDVERNQT